MQPVRIYSNYNIPSVITSNKPKQQNKATPVAFKGGLVTDVVQVASKSNKSILGTFDKVLYSVLGIKKTATPEILEKFQKEFQNLFLREDISINETRNIIKNYQEIAKIKDDKKFTHEIYTELKKNFGFGHVDLPLEFRELQKTKAGTTIASSNVVMTNVSIHPDIKREKAPQVLFHELRHTKQNFLAACYDVKAYVDGIIMRLMPDLANEALTKGYNLSKESIDEGKLRIMASMMNRWGMLVRPRVPKSTMGYAKQCLEAHINYTNPHKNFDNYINNFLEKDAYSADAQFEKIHKMSQKIKIKEK